MSRLLASLATLTLAMAGCGGGGSSSASSRTTTSTRPPGSSSVPPATTAAPAPTSTAPIGTGSGTVSAPSTTAGPGPACPSSPLPSGATSVTTASGSFDGDGQPDVLRAYQAAGTWHLRVELSAGGEVDVTVPNIGTGDAVKAVGGFDIDEGAPDEAFATVGSGGSTKIVGIWKASGFCQLARMTVGGQPSTFPVGATVVNLSGLRCIGGVAVVQALQAQANNTGTQYTGTVTNFDTVGTTLVLGNVSPPQVMAAADPNLAAFGAFTCGGLTLP